MYIPFGDIGSPGDEMFINKDGICEASRAFIAVFALCLDADDERSEPIIDPRLHMHEKIDIMNAQNAILFAKESWTGGIT
ncbi:hypothetical protein DB34_05655 [Acetobacter pasteurianus]|nr:hypothetical protein DB34_05655 [Acetobacter pasteurianus]